MNDRHQEAGSRPGSRHAPPGERSAATPERRYAFLADASRDLAASLDGETIVASVAGRPLPFLGAWCIVDLLEAGGRLRRVAVVHPDPDKRRLVDQLRAGWPPSGDDPFGVPTVLRSLEPELVPTVTAEILELVARDPENLRILRELRMGSLITVPMVARGTLLGAITYIAPETGHTFTDRDVALAMDLAALSALAVENARLHAVAQSAAREAASRRSEAERLATLIGNINERLLLSALRELDAAERAQAVEETRSEFTSSLSHELRTPLTAIMGYTELLLGGQHGPLSEQQVVSLERVRFATRQILRLVEDILMYARIGAHRERVRVRPVDLAAVAREALTMIEPTAVRKGIGLHTDLAADSLVLSTDEDKVRQILLNLVSNAVKFTDDGTVRLEARADGHGVRIRVSDTGRGISDRDRKQIFERFVQGEDDAVGRRGGSGLGLAITQALVELLGGDITMQSEIGAGTTFIVFLPSLDPPAADAVDAESTVA